MKTPPPPKTPDGFVRGSTRIAVLLAGIVVVTTALPPATAAVDGPKDHVLFVGTDLAVKEGNEFYHVVGAKKDSLQIEKSHRLADVRLGQGANIRVTRGVKLSNLSATISKVQTESVDRASARAQLEAMKSSMMLMDEASDQEDRLHGGMTLLSAVAIDPNAAVGAAVSRANLDAMQAAASASYSGALPGIERSTTSASTFLIQNLQTAPIDDEVTVDASALPGLKLSSGSELSGAGFGGSPTSSFMQANVPSGTAEVELTFDVSSPAPLDHAYMVVVANYGSPSNPNEAARQISTREFDHIDGRPQHVKMRHAASVNGLPFRKFDMGLYANGQEVATNLSEKRLALTSDQAFQFFLIDYLSAHKGATLPPAPVLMTPRTEFRRQVGNTAASQTIYANVDKTGNVLAMSTDAAGTQRLPTAVESALKSVRFMPALNNGSPVEGRVKVTLAQLAD